MLAAVMTYLFRFVVYIHLTTIISLLDTNRNLTVEVQTILICEFDHKQIDSSTQIARVFQIVHYVRIQCTSTFFRVHPTHPHVRTLYHPMSEYVRCCHHSRNMSAQAYRMCVQAAIHMSTREQHDHPHGRTKIIEITQ